MTVTSTIPYVDLAAQAEALKPELMEAVERTLLSGQYILSEEVARFEEEFAQLCGTKYAVGVNSGTDALILSLKALGVGEGDEVIAPANTFIATVSAIALVGARPVLVDVLPDYTIDPEKVEQAVTSSSKAIIPVHLTGHPAHMDRLQEIADRHNLLIIEDAAQAICATWKEREVGSLSHAGCFSLHPLKTLGGCGDGGVITTNDSALVKQLHLLRNLGLASRSDAVQWSSNSRLDALQAALLRVKMQHVRTWTAKRRERAQCYREGLSNCPQVQLPLEAFDAEPVYHTFIIRAQARDELQQFLSEQGIGTAIHYPTPIHLQTVGRSLGYGEGNFPEAEQQAKEILSLPVYPELKGQLRIIEEIHHFYHQRG